MDFTDKKAFLNDAPALVDLMAQSKCARCDLHHILVELGRMARRWLLATDGAKPHDPRSIAQACGPPGHKIERPAAIIVFGCEATARDNTNASTDCAAGAFV
jgi:hypothetical protein